MPGFTDTLQALNALKTKLQGIQWNGSPAFQKVDIFDMTNFLVALQELLIYADRICLIMHDLERFESRKDGNQLWVRQTREIELLIADKHFADRQKAMLGDPATQVPGAIALKDIVLNGITGPLIEGVIYVDPLEGQQMVLEKKIRDELQGRIAFTSRYRLVGGNQIFNLGRQPIP